MKANTKAGDCAVCGDRVELGAGVECVTCHDTVCKQDVDGMGECIDCVSDDDDADDLLPPDDDDSDDDFDDDDSDDDFDDDEE